MPLGLGQRGAEHERPPGYIAPLPDAACAECREQVRHIRICSGQHACRPFPIPSVGCGGTRVHRPQLRVIHSQLGDVFNDESGDPMAILRVPINITWAGNGSPGVNVWHVRTTTDESIGADLNIMLGHIRTFYDTIKAMYPAGTTLALGDVVDVQTREFQSGTFATIAAGAAGSALPPSNQICVSWRTSLAARRGMGRTFIGPLTVNTLEANGTIAPTWLTTMTTAAQALVDASTGSANGAVAIWGLESPAPSVLPGQTQDYAALPHVARDITGFRIKDKFASLRSRRD